MTAGRIQFTGMDRGPLAAPTSGDRLGRAVAAAAAGGRGVRAGWSGPSCGAAVTFTGTARDHAAGPPRRAPPRVRGLRGARPSRRLEALAAEVRVRWPDVGRVALLHRTGVVELGEAAVVVAVSAPHRAEAFEAARCAIDELKRTVPIWKREAWAGGESWGLEAQVPSEVGSH